MAQPSLPKLTPADQAMAVATLVKDSMGRWNADQPKGAAVTVQYSFGAKLPDYAAGGTYSASALCPCCGGPLHADGEQAKDGNQEAQEYVSNYYRTAASSFQMFDATTRQQARDALAAWSAVANIDFVEVADSESVGMRFFSLSDPGLSAAGFAVGAGPAGWVGKGERGDIWLNRVKTDEGYNPILLMHEIGHTLGLKHPHEAPLMLKAKDSLQTTIMSYNDEFNYDLKVTWTGYDWKTKYVRLEENGQAHLGIFDVAAAQALYGARTNNISNTYRFETTPFTKMLYDGGGDDVIDLSNQMYGSVLDLTPGAFSSIGKQTLAQAIARKIAELPAESQAYYGQASLYKWFSDKAEYIYLGENNLSIAYNTIIESAVGSAQDDAITGNSANNVIRGGKGSDTLAGGDGTDTAVFGGAYAGYRFRISNETVLVFGADGVDTLTGFELLQFDDRTVRVSSLTNTLPASSFLGTANDDQLIGTPGDDFFYGGAGNDTLIGGAGTDIAYFNGNYSQYRVTRGQDAIVITGPDGRDSLSGIEKLQFSDGASVDTASLVPPGAAVYRFYNKNTGTHFYTIDPKERDAVLVKLTAYVYEGEAFKAQTDNADGQGLAVFRFYNRATGTHFYTANPSERDSVLKLTNYAYEGTAYYASATADNDYAPLHRFYNTRTGAHFYTASDSEFAAVIKLAGFNYEGIAYYVDA